MARGSFRPGRFRTKCDPDEWMIHTMSSSVSSSSWKASHASRAVLKLISLGCTSNISAVSHMRSRTRLYARMATAISRSRLSGVRRQAAEFAHTHRGFIRPDIDFHIPPQTVQFCDVCGREALSAVNVVTIVSGVSQPVTR